MNPLSDIEFLDIFSHSVDCLFTVLMVSFHAQKEFDEVQFTCFFHFLPSFSCQIKKTIANLNVLKSSPCVFYSNSFYSFSSCI